MAKYFFSDNMPHTLWIWNVVTLKLYAVLIQSSPIKGDYRMIDSTQQKMNNLFQVDKKTVLNNILLPTLF